VLTFMGVASFAMTVIRVGLVAPCVRVCGMTCRARDFALAKASALHKAQGLKADVLDVIIVAGRWGETVARPAESDVSQIVQLTGVDRPSTPGGVLLRPRMTMGTLDAWGDASQILANETGVAIEAGTGVGIRLS
jgi:hypothetical protein